LISDVVVIVVIYI